MERSKVKLTVIFLLVVLNLFLVIIVLVQNYQTDRYTASTREQALRYLQARGIEAKLEDIPWNSAMDSGQKRSARLLLDGQSLPEGVLPEECEVLGMHQPETLLRDFAAGLARLDTSCGAIQAIREGYRYSQEDGHSVLTPMWRIETDHGVFLLDCASGELSNLE